MRTGAETIIATLWAEMRSQEPRELNAEDIARFFGDPSKGVQMQQADEGIYMQGVYSMTDRRPYTVQPIMGDDRYGIVGPDYKRVAMQPVDNLEHAKDMAEALSEAHERRKQREAGGS